MTLRPNSPAARDVTYSLHPYTNARKHEQKGPMIIERGKGIYVYDDQGREYIEGLAGLWSVGPGREPALHTLQVMPVPQTQILVTHALAAGQQTVGELFRLEMHVSAHILEPFHGIARGILQLERFRHALVLIGVQRGRQFAPR